MKAIELNSQNFYDVIAGEKPVLVDFWAPWCVYCRRIAPTYDKIAAEFGDKLIIAKLNIDDAPDVALKEQIEVIPTLVLYHKGKALGFVVAPESKAKIEELIRQSV